MAHCGANRLAASLFRRLVCAFGFVYLLHGRAQFLFGLFSKLFGFGGVSDDSWSHEDEQFGLVAIIG